MGFSDLVSPRTSETVTHTDHEIAPELLSDTDDTAKALLSLHLIGKSPSPVPMINEFDGEGHFRTYKMERNPSFSANANALVALLYTPDPSLHIDQISKTVSFLCDAWWEGTINDKWVCYLPSTVYV